MTSLQRIQAVMARQIPDRVPVCLHNFLLAAKEAGVSLNQYRTDPQAVAKAHLAALEKYQHDCILIDLDTTMLAEAMGAGAECAPGEPGRIVRSASESLSQVDDLKPLDPRTDGRIPALLDGIRLIAKEVGGEVAIRGNCDQGAFSLACLVRGIEDFMVDLATQPDNPAIGRLLEVCYESHLATHRAVKQAGAHFTSLGDSLAGPDVLSPKMFRQFARPYQEKLVRQLASEGIFTVIHICGDTTSILDDLSRNGFCGFELDFKTCARTAKMTVGKNHVLFGNIDPSGVIARATSNEVDERSRELIALWKPHGLFVLNAGCAIPAVTSPENVQALVAAARKYGAYDR